MVVMRAKDSGVAPTVIDTWMAAVEHEFGVGWQSATLRGRTHDIVADLIAAGDGAAQHVTRFGEVLGRENLDLGFATTCLQLLTQSAANGGGASGGGTGTAGSRAAGAGAGPLRLDTKAIAVALADGWNTGISARQHLTQSGVTPMPVMLQMLRQRYRSSQLPLAVAVVDVQSLTCSQLEQMRVRSAVLRLAQSVFHAGQPLAEGGNGNLIALVDRDELSLALVAELRLRIAGDPALSAQRLHVWLEPLSASDVHLEAHLAGLAGDIEPSASVSRGVVPRPADDPSLSWPSRRPRSVQAPAKFRRDRPMLPG